MALDSAGLRVIFERLKKKGVPSKKEREKAVRWFKKHYGEEAWKRFLEETDLSKINKDIEKLVNEDMARMKAERERKDLPDYLL